MSYITKNIVEFRQKNNYTGGAPEAGSTLEPAVVGVVAAAAGHIGQPGQEQPVPAAEKAAGAAAAVAEEEPVRVPAADTGMPWANRGQKVERHSMTKKQKRGKTRLQYHEVTLWSRTTRGCQVTYLLRNPLSRLRRGDSLLRRVGGHGGRLSKLKRLLLRKNRRTNIRVWLEHHTTASNIPICHKPLWSTLPSIFYQSKYFASNL